MYDAYYVVFVVVVFMGSWMQSPKLSQATRTHEAYVQNKYE